ncbi:hypothetical protein [Pseudonocardia sp. WMMC193]|uniref:hypothetical protein n=1 Tax=Pseudonocardia sp. WMMC193 TaxID=2911965 RepID=UPI001F23F0F9|nr:hypothetical protein [Pseudonocardia sp. WMMC193]MCF7552661.1 hypothetical protein [Pseudonocardia sp. WMMC193]
MLSGREHAVLAGRRLGRRLLVLLLVLAVLGAAGAVAFVGVSFLMFTPVRAGSCEPNPERTPIEASGASGLTAEQLSNAAAIVSTGRSMAVPERGLWVGLATALQESGLRNLDYGDRDSLGLFQQRPSQGWGNPAQVRDPAYAAERFFERLLAVPAWTEMPLWQAAQTVQRSGFPLAYAKWEQTAADALAEVASSPAAAPRARPVASPSAADSGAAPGACRGEPREVDPAAPFAGNSNGCTADDPTTNGCVTPVTRYALDQAERAFGGLRRGELMRSTGCHASRPSNPTSDHPLGKGCDFFPGTPGLGAQGVELANGWRAAEWFRTNAAALEVSYIIWQGRIWTPGVPDEGGWGRRYSGGGVYDPTDAVGGHYDHIHVSFER